MRDPYTPPEAPLLVDKETYSREEVLGMLERISDHVKSARKTKFQIHIEALMMTLTFAFMWHTIGWFMR